MANEQSNITIIVNQGPFHISDSTITAEDIRGFVDSPEDYEVWHVVGNPDPEGQLPVDDIQVTSEVEVKSGDRFRVVPPGTFGTGS